MVWVWLGDPYNEDGRRGGAECVECCNGGGDKNCECDDECECDCDWAEWPNEGAPYDCDGIDIVAIGAP